MVDIVEIVKEYLKKNGFDGLWGPGCGCGVDDLMPCDCHGNCVPAYRWDCQVCEHGRAQCAGNSGKPGGCYHRTKQAAGEGS